MLNDESKQRLINAHKSVINQFGSWKDADPVETLQALIDCGHEIGEHDKAKHLEDNRKEAEQYLAGLMGMM